MTSVNASRGQFPVEKITPSPIGKKEVAQNETPSEARLRPRIIRPGHAATGGPSAAGPSLAQTQPTAKSQVANPFSVTLPASDLYFGYASPGGQGFSATQKPSHTRSSNEAIAGEVDKIIAKIRKEIEADIEGRKILAEGDNTSQPSAYKDPSDFYAEIALLNLNKYYQLASQPVKQALLASSLTQQFIDTIVTTICSGDTPHVSNLLDVIIGGLDPTLKNAVLKRIFEGREFRGAVYKPLSAEERREIDQLMTKAEELKLPRDIHFSLLTQATLYPSNLKNVTHYLSMLIKKPEFLKPTDQKHALSHQHSLIAGIGDAAGDPDLDRVQMNKVLDRVLGDYGIKLEVKSLKVTGDYYHGRMRIDEAVNAKTYPAVLTHEDSHATHNDDLMRGAISELNGEIPKIAEYTVTQLKGEIVAWIAEYGVTHKHLPSPREIYQYIHESFLDDSTPIDLMWIKEAFNDQALSPTMFRAISELIGMDLNNLNDTKRLDLKLKTGLAHLSTEPLSRKAVDAWHPPAHPEPSS